MKAIIIGIILSLSLYSYGQPDSIKSFSRQFMLAASKSDDEGMYKALTNHMELIIDETASMESCNKYIEYTELYLQRWRVCTENELQHGNCGDRQLRKNFAEGILASALTTRSRIKYNLQDYYGCKDDLQHANELEPFDAEIPVLLGSINIEFGNKDEGCLQLSKAGEKGQSTVYEIIKQYCH